MDTDIPKERKQFDVSIRLIKEGDIESLKPILETWIVDRDTGRPLPEEVEEDLQKMKDSARDKNDHTYLVAETIEGEVIGVIGFRNPDERMRPFTQTPNPTELVTAYVAKEHRGGKGLGRALVAKLEDEARKKGHSEIVLNSGPRYKYTGWGFYDRLEGYQRVGIAKNYYGEGGDAPVWRREL